MNLIVLLGWFLDSLDGDLGPPIECSIEKGLSISLSVRVQAQAWDWDAVVIQVDDPWIGWEYCVCPVLLKFSSPFNAVNRSIVLESHLQLFGTNEEIKLYYISLTQDSFKTSPHREYLNYNVTCMIKRLVVTYSLLSAMQPTSINSVNTKKYLGIFICRKKLHLAFFFLSNLEMC